MSEYQEIINELEKFERVEEITDIVLIGKDGGIRRIEFEYEG